MPSTVIAQKQVPHVEKEDCKKPSAIKRECQDVGLKQSHSQVILMDFQARTVQQGKITRKWLENWSQRSEKWSRLLRSVTKMKVKVNCFWLSKLALCFPSYVCILVCRYFRKHPMALTTHLTGQLAEIEVWNKEQRKRLSKYVVGHARMNLIGHLNVDLNKNKTRTVNCSREHRRSQDSAMRTLVTMIVI